MPALEDGFEYEVGEAQEDLEAMYNLDNYTDDEIIVNILNLDIPTNNRILEAKIVGLIRSYRQQKIPELEMFFTNVYIRLFNLQQTDSGELVPVAPIDGDGARVTEYLTGTNEASTPEITGVSLGNAGAVGAVGVRSGSASVIDVSSTTAPAPTEATGNVKISEYSKGTLNPLLKETCTKLIHIDSQHRHSTYPYSTDFTLNFGEVIKNVVKLHLYSITIPYQWYTISRAYGSNFFVFSAVSPGINTGNHDFVVQVDPGTYTAEELIVAITRSIDDLKTAYPDTDFGTTAIEYTSNTARARITFDVRTIYATSYFSAQFGATPFVYPSDPVAKNFSLSAYLGFNAPGYQLTATHSLPITNIDSTLIIAITSATATFTLYQYRSARTTFPSGTGLTPFDVSDTANILDTVPFTLPVGRYTQASLIDAVNLALTTNAALSPAYSGVSLSTYPIDHVYHSLVTIDWRIQLARQSPSTLYSALALVFPNDEVWTSDTGFNFGLPEDVTATTFTVELNDLVAESPLPPDNFVVGATDAIIYSCLADDVVLPNKTAYISESSSGYSLSQYMAAINAAIQTAQLGSSPNNLAFADARFHLQVDLSTTFDAAHFSAMAVSGEHYLASVLNVSSLTGAALVPDGTGKVVITGEFAFQNGAAYSITDSSILFSLGISAAGEAAGFANPTATYTVPLVQVTYVSDYTLAGLNTQINLSFQNFLYHGKPILRGSSIAFVPNYTTATVAFTMTLLVVRTVTESEYKVQFVTPAKGTNHWSNLFGLEPDYILADLPVTINPYIQINGASDIDSTRLQLEEDAPLSLIPNGTIDGIAGSGAPGVVVPRGEYTRQQLFNVINTQFAQSDSLRGSLIDAVVGSAGEYTRIRFSVHKTYTSADYSLLFYDTARFVTCFVGNSSIRNVRPDETLGWILGFKSRQTYPALATTTLGADGYEYYASTTNRYTVDWTSGAYTLWGDSTVNVNIYNSFFVIIRDYNQNRLNDNVVTIAAPDYQFSLPSYASRYASVCDPISNQRQSIGLRSGEVETLTQRQIYAASQVLDAQNARTSSANQPGGIYLTDVFAAIPLKLGSTPFGQNHTEMSGTLQNQERIYFGPVNINRMAIQLVNDKGDPVDLNGQNWSMQIRCEYLYKNV